MVDDACDFVVRDNWVLTARVLWRRRPEFVVCVGDGWCNPAGSFTVERVVSVCMHGRRQLLLNQRWKKLSCIFDKSNRT